MVNKLRKICSTFVVIWEIQFYAYQLSKYFFKNLTTANTGEELN